MAVKNTRVQCRGNLFKEKKRCRGNCYLERLIELDKFHGGEIKSAIAEKVELFLRRNENRRRIIFLVYNLDLNFESNLRPFYLQMVPFFRSFPGPMQGLF